jgi:hypothetical protein
MTTGRSCPSADRSGRRAREGETLIESEALEPDCGVNTIVHEPEPALVPYGVIVAVAGSETGCPSGKMVRYTIRGVVQELSSMLTEPTRPWKPIVTLCAAAPRELKLSALGVTIKPFVVVDPLTTIGTAKLLDPETTVTLHVPWPIGVAVNDCGEVPPFPVTVAMPAHAAASNEIGIGPPLPVDVTVYDCGWPPRVNVSPVWLPLMTVPVCVPTVTPSAADLVPIVTTIEQLPFAIGVMV